MDDIKVLIRHNTVHKFISRDTTVYVTQCLLPVCRKFFFLWTEEISVSLECRSIKKCICAGSQFLYSREMKQSSFQFYDGSRKYRVRKLSAVFLRYRSAVKTFLRGTRGLIEKRDVKLRELFAVLFALLRIIRIECSGGRTRCVNPGHETDFELPRTHIGLTLRE